MTDQAIIALMPDAAQIVGGIYWRRARVVDIDDLRADAYLAITDAARKYIPSRGPYERYALYRAKKAILDAYRKAHLMPRRMAGHTRGLAVSIDDVELGSKEISPEVAAMAAAELTPKRMRIVELVAEGMSNRQIAAEVGCSVQVLKNNLRVVFALAGVKSRMELAMLYVKRPGAAEEIQQRVIARKSKWRQEQINRRKTAEIARLEAKLAAARAAL